MILCLDDAVGSAALSWDVPARKEGQFQFFEIRCVAKSSKWPKFEIGGKPTSRRVLPYRSPFLLISGDEICGVLVVSGEIGRRD